MDQSAPPPKPSLPITIESSRDLQCVGTMEIAAPKPIGFLCGSLPVLADNSFPTFTSALLPSHETYVLASSPTQLLLLELCMKKLFYLYLVLLQS